MDSGRVVYMNGKFVPEREAKISIFDSALMFGDMVFEMTRSFNKKQFKLREHLERLYAKEGLSKECQPVKPVTYSIVKSGLIGLTRYLSTYWADKGVRCNAICPGGVENGQSENFLRSVSSRIPMGRLANVDEYQGAIVWMVSDASSYLNGSIISIDGGRTAW